MQVDQLMNWIHNMYILTSVFKFKLKNYWNTYTYIQQSYTIWQCEDDYKNLVPTVRKHV